LEIVLERAFVFDRSMRIEDSKNASRRQFLKATGLAGTVSVLGGSQVASAAASMPGAAVTNPGAAKNVIFLVVDGLCHGTVGLAHQWSLRHRGTKLNWLELFERDDFRRAYQDTASASSPVTDSAAAATAWGSGQRVNNGSINTDPTGRALKPILSYAKDAGKATGLVSTCRITHATPAGFIANVASRDEEDTIARQYLERGVDVLLGGGARHFKQLQEDGTEIDLVPQFKSAGYTVVNDTEGLAGAKGRGPLLGLFADSHVPYAIDRANDSGLAQVPGLKAMFEAALNRLERMGNGFFLQVESGRVDHAGHANDPAAILQEFLEYDACLPMALEYIENHPDTLLIITTDHGTGGCQLDGSGEAYVGSGPALDRINSQRHSFEWVESKFRPSGQFSAEPIRKAFGIEPSEAQGAIIQAALDAEVRYLSGAITDAFGEELNARTSVGWSSSKHTAECTDLFAFGPGAERLTPWIKNAEVFSLLRSAMAGKKV
jgi:alkaline phosphatase